MSSVIRTKRTSNLNSRENVEPSCDKSVGSQRSGHSDVTELHRNGSKYYSTDGQVPDVVFRSGRDLKTALEKVDESIAEFSVRRERNIQGRRQRPNNNPESTKSFRKEQRVQKQRLNREPKSEKRSPKRSPKRASPTPAASTPSTVSPPASPVPSPPPPVRLPSASGLIRLSLPKPMGIVFEPIVDEDGGDDPRGVRICELPPTGAAARSCQLRVGDELLILDETTVSRSTFDEVMDVIIGADHEHVNMLFRRPPKKDRYEPML